MGRLLSALGCAAVLCFAAPARAQEGAGAAAELQTMCRADAGELWGAPLCGPLLVVEPSTRAAWASVPDGQGLFSEGGGGWVGVLPAGVGVANTSLDWGGARWIMVLSPLPEDAAERRVLLAHEAWHRVQADIGMPAQEGANAHLATERGRTLMRLELRALATALRSRGRGQMRAAQDALVLRAARHAAFAPARAEETALDRNEGLAAYTGVRLGADEPLQFALRTLDQSDRHEALARAYAYASGPAYGLLLDIHRPGWRTDLGGAAPADLLAVALRFGVADRSAVAQASARYGGAQVTAEEQTRAQAAAAQLAALRAGYAGPRLELQLRNPQFEFDPNQATPIEGLGTHYRTLTLRDAWGELHAAAGALLSADFSAALALAPGPDGLSGPGWRLTLAPGWRVLPPLNGAPWRVAPTRAQPE